jgi:hypothetical protein
VCLRPHDKLPVVHRWQAVLHCFPSDTPPDQRIISFPGPNAAT